MNLISSHFIGNQTRNKILRKQKAILTTKIPQGKLIDLNFVVVVSLDVADPEPN